MNRRDGGCDVCMGTEFEPYLQSSPCGRTLERCRGCGLVTAGPDSGEGSSVMPAARDRRADHRRAAAVMKILPAGSVLEVGCGEGHFLSALDAARYEVVGVERSPEAAEAAGRQITGAGLRGGVRASGLLEAALPSETFDLAALFGFIASAASPRAVCMEVARLLRPGGFAVIETPSLSSMTALLCGTRWRPLRDPRADYFFTPSSMERLATACGLSPGVTRLPVPAGWPSPGTLVYVARKSAVAQRVASLSDLAANVGTIAPMGAAH